MNRYFTFERKILLPLSATSFKSLEDQLWTQYFLTEDQFELIYDTLVQTWETVVFHLHLPGRHNLLFNQQVTLLASWYIEIRASFWIVLRSCKRIENSNNIKWSRFYKKRSIIYIYIDTGLHEWYFLVFVNSKNIHNRLQPWFLSDKRICNQACN